MSYAANITLLLCQIANPATCERFVAFAELRAMKTPSACLEHLLPTAERWVASIRPELAGRYKTKSARCVVVRTKGT